MKKQHVIKALSLYMIAEFFFFHAEDTKFDPPYDKVMNRLNARIRFIINKQIKRNQSVVREAEIAYNVLIKGLMGITESNVPMLVAFNIFEDFRDLFESLPKSMEININDINELSVLLSDHSTVSKEHLEGTSLVNKRIIEGLS